MTDASKRPPEDPAVLAELTRAAAAKAYEADSSTASKLTIWLITVLGALHASGLLATFEHAQDVYDLRHARIFLITGLIGALGGGFAAMIHYNALAEQSRWLMHLIDDGNRERIENGSNLQRKIAYIFDRLASGFLAGSVLCLIGAAISAG